MPLAQKVMGVGLTAELMLFRAYGPRGNTSDMLKRTLALNPGLSRLSAVLPLQTPILLADLPAAPKRQRRRGVSLFEDE